ncbi:MAG TPA: hypothetical protein VF720_01330 [Candidatus Eisenbacteria bacterium]
MTERQLTIERDRQGAPLVAYLYLPAPNGRKSAQCHEVEPGYVVDIDSAGVLIGVEFFYPDEVQLAILDRILEEHHAPPVTPADLAPLKVA